MMRSLQDTTTRAQDTNTFSPDPVNVACHLLYVRVLDNRLKPHSQNYKMLKENFRKLSKLKEIHSDAQGETTAP